MKIGLHTYTQETIWENKYSFICRVFLDNGRKMSLFTLINLIWYYNSTQGKTFSSRVIESVNGLKKVLWASPVYFLSNERGHSGGLNQHILSNVLKVNVSENQWMNNWTDELCEDFSHAKLIQYFIVLYCSLLLIINMNKKQSLNNLSPVSRNKTSQLLIELNKTLQ